MSAHAVQARLDALWWANEHPAYWIATRGPTHHAGALTTYRLTILKNNAEGGDGYYAHGSEVAAFTGVSMDEVLDQLVAWRVAQRMT